MMNPCDVTTELKPLLHCYCRVQYLLTFYKGKFKNLSKSDFGHLLWEEE